MLGSIRCHRYGRDGELVAKASSGILSNAGLGTERCCKSDWNLGQFRAVLVADGRQQGVLLIKIISQCREQARRAYYGAVSRSKKEIPVSGEFVTNRPCFHR